MDVTDHGGRRYSWEADLRQPCLSSVSEKEGWTVELPGNQFDPNPKQVQHVHFDEIVDVVACHEDDETTLHMSLAVNELALHLRNLWSLDGQHATWTGFVHYFHRIAAQGQAVECPLNDDQTLGAFRSSHSENGPTVHTRQSCKTDTQDNLLDDPSFFSFFALVPEDQMRITIDTWFVSVDRFPVCSASRPVQVMRGDTSTSFEQRCRMTWSDPVQDHEFVWKFVHSSSLSGAPNSPQLILKQDPGNFHKVALARYDGYPILRRFRAIVYSPSDIVEMLIRRLGIGRACSQAHIRCAIHCDGPDGVVFFEQQEMVGCSDAAFIHVHVMDVAPDSASDDDSDGETVSTRTGHSASDLELGTDSSDADTDEAVFMSVGMPVQCRIPEIIDFSHLRQDQQENIDHDDPPTTDEEAPVMEPHVRDALDLATRQVRNGPVLVVTFGLGLTSLGRGDAECHAEGIAGIVFVINQLWQDFEDYGHFSFHLITPQPNLGIARTHVAIVVVVHFNGIPRPWEAAPTLVQQTGALDMIHIPHAFAAWLPRRASFPSVLRGLGRERDILPHGPRTVAIQLGARVLTENRLLETDDGDLCLLDFGEYPDWILHTMQTIGNAEQLYIDRFHQVAHRPSDWIAIRCHGISPQNLPLGSRILWVTSPEFETTSWLSQASALWPFEAVDIRIVYAGGEEAVRPNQGRPAFEYQFIVDYHPDDFVPVLIHQSIRAVEDQTYHAEDWAIRVPAEISNVALIEFLPQAIFWLNWPDSLRIYRTDLAPQVLLGDRIELFLYVSGRLNLLAMLVEHGTSASDEVPEAHSLLQTTARLVVPSTPFAEICTALLTSAREVEEVRVQETFKDDSCSGNVVGCEPEDNVDLRSTGIIAPSISMQDQARHENFRNDPICYGLETAEAMQACDLQSDMNVSTIQGINAALDPLLHQPWQGLNQNFELIHGLHPMAQAALSVVQEGHDQVNTFHVFTDGSAKGGIASWAFVVVAESCVGEHRFFQKIGYSGDLLSDDIGPYNPTSLDAEATAIIGATEYLLSRSFPTHIQVNLHLHFDCTAVGWGSVGKQNVVCKKGDSNRQEDARILISLLQAKHGLVGHHVHAHQGQPWNEMADSVATWIRCGGQCQIVPVLKCASLLQNPWKKWAWMQVRPTVECPDLQTILSKVDVPAIASSPDSSFAQVTIEAEDGVSSTQSYCTLRLATFNAGTFEYRFEKNELPTSHKAKEIMHQLDRAHYDFVAVQETRARHDQTWTDGPFLRFISAGNAGQAGVELWVHEYHLARKLDRPIQSSDFTVWYNDPRLLCVHFDLDRHGVDIVVCYAPQAGRPEDEICAFWDHCQKVLEQRAWQAPVWFMGDINGKIGCLESNSVGSFAADMEDVGGQCFHRLCDTFNWIVPATFAKWHQGASTTFVSALGHETRLDFIAVDEFFEEGIQSSYVDDSIDLLNGDMDHRVVVLELTFVPQGTRREGYKRKHWYDRNRAKAHCKHECQALTQLNAIAWDKATTEHWDIMRDHLQFTMSKLFPCRKRQKSQLYFNEESWSLVCQRKDIRMEFRSLQRVSKWLLLKRCFQGWRKSDDVDVQKHNLERRNNRMQLALTYEERCKTDEAFRKQKRLDWKLGWTADSQTSQGSPVCSRFGYFSHSETQEGHS